MFPTFILIFLTVCEHKKKEFVHLLAKYLINKVKSDFENAVTDRIFKFRVDCK